ncbi:hypothetical protein IM774_03115 [Erysipelotrichaceae bacterium RD49]|nr:hypothetical protein [Erysipelotrichaceae bacterium RD49]
MKNHTWNLACWIGFGMIMSFLIPKNGWYCSLMGMALLVTSNLLVFTPSKRGAVIYLAFFCSGASAGCLLQGGNPLDLMSFVLIVFCCYPAVALLCQPGLKKAAFRSVAMLGWVLFILTLPKPMVPGLLASALLTMLAMQFASYGMNPFDFAMWEQRRRQKQELARIKAHNHKIEQQMMIRFNELTRTMPKHSVSSYKNKVSA